MNQISVDEIVTLAEDQKYSIKLIEHSGVFQTDYYKKQYLDSDDIEPVAHYCEVGHLLNMNPSSSIDGFKIKTAFKAESNKHANPLTMFILYRIHQSFPFDSDWYEKNYKIKKDKAIDHFSKVGIFTGNYPNPEFNDSDYLDANPDLKGLKISPLFYHALKGAAEGRKLKKQRNRLALSDDLQHAREQILKLKLFDEKRYLSLYPDVDESGVDPLDHYLVQGWTENRNPSAKFDPLFYLEIYKDVKNANINPLAHFATAGIVEGRMPIHPERLRFNRIDETYIEVARREKITSPKLSSIKSIPKLVGKVIVSFSHDLYYKYNGGIQLVIRQEEYIHKKNGTYLHVCPVYGNDQINQISINGKHIGNFYVADSLKYLKSLSPDAVLVHHVKGFDQAFLNSLFKEYSSVKSKYFWLHDYYAWCSNHLLMRNGISYCGAPNSNSSACDTCAYGNERYEHLKYVQTLLTVLRPTMISPSEYPAKLFKKDFSASNLKVTVRPHLTIEGRSYQTKRTIDKLDNSIKIGFLGEPVYHKGWNDFLRLVDEYSENSNIKFYVFSSKDPQDSRVHYIKTTLVDFGSSSKYLMEQANLDYLLFLSKWPETFGLSVLEGLAAGAKVISYKDIYAVKENKNIESNITFVDSYDDLKDLIKNLTLDVKRDNFKFKNQMSIEYWSK